MMKRFCVVASSLALIACGSSTPSSSDLCSKAQTVSNNLIQKIAACGVSNVSTGIPSGAACTQAVASCNDNDRSVLNAILDCLNGLPTLTAPQCTGQAATDFGNQAQACTSTRAGQLSAACSQAAGF